MRSPSTHPITTTGPCPTVLLFAGLLLAGLLSSPLAAAPAGTDGAASCPATLLRTAAGADEGPLLDAAAPSVQQLVFVPLPDRPIRHFELAVLAPDGARLVAERLDLPADRQGNAVELLAYRPDLLLELHRRAAALAAAGDGQLTLVASADGAEVVSMPWPRTANAGGEEPAAYGPIVDPIGFKQVVAAPTTLLEDALTRPEPALALRADQECIEDCADEYDQCDLYCDPYGSGPGSCIWCYEQFEECKDYCDECPFVTQIVTEVPVAYTPQAQQLCLIDDVFPSFPPYEEIRFQRYRIQIKRTVTERSTNCDGTVTFTVLSVDYYYRTCYLDLDIPCFNAIIPASVYCTFQ